MINNEKNLIIQIHGLWALPRIVEHLYRPFVAKRNDI